MGLPAALAPGGKVVAQVADSRRGREGAVWRTPFPHPVRLPWLIGLILCGLASAQQPGFDAAEIKPSKDDFSHGDFGAGGRLELRGYTLLDFIRLAYGVEPSAVAGGPNWLDDDRFDLSAIGAASRDPLAGKKMLQAMLAERFHLSVHVEDKPTPVFALTVLKKSAGLVRSETSPGECQTSLVGGLMTFKCAGVSMAQFAADIHRLAGGYLNRPVVDKTGLTEGYDFTLRWTRPAALRKGDSADSSAELNLTVFQAVEQQLGLRFQPGTEPLPALTVDRVDRAPTLNVPDIAKLLHKDTAFEVADLKPSGRGETLHFRTLPGGRVEAQATPLETLFLYAFNTRERSVVNLPKWMATDLYDLSAKAPSADASSESIRVMLQAMLADRFGLKTHYEDRPEPVYVLTAPKRGAGLKESDGAERSNCKSGTNDNAQATLTCRNMTMAQFANKIGDYAGSYFDRPVIDQTGLTGAYDFTISWTSKGRYLGDSDGGVVGSPASGATIAAPPGGVTALQAVEKLLGSKIESQKRPREVLVIDAINRKPSGN